MDQITTHFIEAREQNNTSTHAQQFDNSFVNKQNVVQVVAILLSSRYIRESVKKVSSDVIKRVCDILLHKCKTEELENTPRLAD